MLITLNGLMNKENTVTISQSPSRYDETWDLELAEHLSLNPNKYLIVTSDDVDIYSNFLKLHNHITDKHIGKTSLHKFITLDGVVMSYRVLDVNGFVVVNPVVDGGLLVYYLPVNIEVEVG